MGKCIRCGKPCGNGENMCDDCKAWFQEKTGGSTVPGVKIKPQQRPNTTTTSKTNENKHSEEPKEQKIIERSPEKEKQAEIRQSTQKPETNNKNIVVPKKTLIIVIAAVLAVLVVVIIIISLKGKKDNSYTIPQYDNVQDDLTAENDTEGAEDADVDYADNDITTENNQASENQTPVNVINIRDKYIEQIDKYSSNNVESVDVAEGRAYYLDNELVEFDRIEEPEWEIDYYYDNGVVYYAHTSSLDGGESELFYGSGELIYWIDNEGSNHSAAEAEDNWGDTVDEAESLYTTYADKANTGLGETSEYILPNSDKEYISESDLDGLSEWEVRIARNEIMARHGRKFKDQSLQDYFNSCSWYSGTVEPDDFDKNYESNLNEYEKKNASTIKQYEKEKGFNQ